MDHENLRALNRMRPSSSSSVVKMFGEFDPDGDVVIRDPYYGGDNGFERNFQQCLRCSLAFLASLGFEA